MGTPVLLGDDWLLVHVCLADTPFKKPDLPAILSCMDHSISYRGIGKQHRNLCWQRMSQNRRRSAHVLHFSGLLRSYINAPST